MLAVCLEGKRPTSLQNLLMVSSQGREWRSKVTGRKLGPWRPEPHITMEGKGDRRDSPPPLCEARKIHHFQSIHRGSPVRSKEYSARGLIIPLQSGGPASRPGILAKRGALNLEASQNPASSRVDESVRHGVCSASHGQA
jgi:hypothetical protein